MTVLSSQRHLFDIPPDIAYFNCAYNAPRLNETSRRLAAGITVKNHPREIMPADYFTDAETVRNLAAAVFGGEADGYRDQHKTPFLQDYFPGAFGLN